MDTIQHFNITFSTKGYEQKPKNNEYSNICLSKQSVTLDEFITKVKQGYGFTSNFHDHDEQFGFSNKKSSNFDYTHLLTLDIDHENITTPGLLYNTLNTNDIRPTYIYTSYSHNPQKEQKYHLIYVFQDKIKSIDTYKTVYQSIKDKIHSHVLLKHIQFDDNLESGVQYVNGTNSQTEYFDEYRSNNLFNLSDFIEVKNDDKHKIITNNTPTCCPFKNNKHRERNILTLTGQFKDNFYNLSYNNFISKYCNTYKYITENQLEYNQEYNGIKYIDFEEDKTEYVKILRAWTTTDEGKKMIKKTEEGKRIKTLYIRGLYFRKIWELNKWTMTDEQLIYCLVYELVYFMNYHGMEKNRVWSVAESVKNADISKLKHKQSKFKIDPSMMGNKRQMSGQVRGHRTMTQIAQYYDFSKSERENSKYIKQLNEEMNLNIPSSKGTMHRFIQWANTPKTKKGGRGMI